MYKLIVIHEADLELQEAVVWYEERGAGLGVRLLRIVKEKPEIIQKYPERYTKRKKKFSRINFARVSLLDCLFFLQK